MPALSNSLWPEMTYEESVRSLLSLGKELASPQQASVQKFNLENIRVLSEHLGQPHRAVPCAHIAGTNGKGSTAAMLESIVRASGFSTGLFTSPHLERINERIAFSGKPISDSDFAAALTRVHAATERLLARGELAAHPTFFECITAMAFDAFAQRRLGFAVYETGMGGRLDSTNIVSPEVAIITQVDFDHENFLGHSIPEIAAEKAGIIKPGGWVVSAVERPEARAVIAQRSASVGARLVEVENFWRVENVFSRNGCYHVIAAESHSGTRLTLEIPLPGRFQIRNALAAATAARLLAGRGFAINHNAIEEGIREVRWPGRLERMSSDPAVFLDGAHNPASAHELAGFIQEHLSGRRIWLVFAALRDKAVDEIAGLIFPHAHHVFFTQPPQSRAISAPLLAEMTSHLAQRFEIVVDPIEALHRALSSAAREDAIIITGSLYLVGYLRGQFAQPRANADVGSATNPRVAK